jgi:hypothetical protein
MNGTMANIFLENESALKWQCQFAAVPAVRSSGSA